jgi:hypothetical protein
MSNRNLAVSPHWEYGFRCHGLWALPHQRIGWVSLPPRVGPVATWGARHVGYSWGIRDPVTGGYIEGSARTLRTAKRRVEREAVRLYVW